MNTTAATTDTTEKPKPDAIATVTSPESIRSELDKATGDGLKGAKGALALAGQGVVLTNLDDAYRFATLIQTTGLAPKDLNTPAKILLAMQMGMEVGLPPMASIQNIAVINGRPSLWGDICLALVRKSGFFDEEAFEQVWEYDQEGNATKATCTVRRLPNGKVKTYDFTIKEARQAELASKDIWKKYPKRMLMNRARAFALRDSFADVLKGVLIAEEAQDMPEKIVTGSATVESRKPETLNELTEQMNGSAQAAPVETQAETAEAEIVENAAADPLPPGFAARLANLHYVGPVERLLVEYTGLDSTLTATQKNAVAEACKQRIAEIKRAKKNGGNEQPTLV